MRFRNMTLNTRLIVMFLLVSLIPLVLSNLFFFHAIEDAIHSDLLKDLAGRLEIKSEAIARWFTERRGDIRLLSTLRESARGIDALTRAAESTGYTGAEYPAAMAVYETLFMRYGTIYGYDDLLLISPKGDVVYSNARGPDYMTNVVHGPFAGTALATAFEKSLRGNTHLCDFIAYGPADGRPVMFLSAPILAENNIAGVMVVRLSDTSIREIMREKEGMGETGETWLVGRDYLMRSDSRFNQTNETDIIRTRIKTDMVRNAFSGRTSGQAIDNRGETVFAVSDRLNVEGLDWAIVAKLDRKEATAIIKNLYYQLVFVFGTLFIVISVLAWILAKSLSRPLTDMAGLARELARGNLDVSTRIQRGDEIGDLAAAFQILIESQREVSQTVSAIAAGNLNVTVKEKSDADDLAISINQMVMVLKTTARQAKVVADGDYSPSIEPRSDRDELGYALQGMIAALRENSEQNRRKDWLQKGNARLNDVVIGENDIQALTSNVLSEMVTWLDAQAGTFYIRDEDSDGPFFRLLGTYAYAQRKNISNRYRPGEGLVGQAALEKKRILIRNVPENYIPVVSGLGESMPHHICIIPLLYENGVKGVIETAFLNPVTSDAFEYLDQAAPRVAVAIEIVQARQRMELALEKSQQLTAELEAQQNALQQTNSELEEQTARLKLSEQELQQQQAELERSNAELEEQTAQLKTSEQKLQQQQTSLELTNEELTQTNKLLERQKTEIEQARREIAEQAEEVALASKYKSEFLANMSHELRTPLNSLLLLARALKENSDGNLTDDQVASAKVIFESGSDLLNLINDILDLSKIEAGRMELHPGAIDLKELQHTILSRFDHMARAQGLSLDVNIEADAPETIVSDMQRLGQVLKNLVGNALKFTEVGGITITFTRPEPGSLVSGKGLEPEETLAIHVRDTGIGIPRDKQKIIFEAFQQADSGDRRRYGGTGLGLSISREIVTLLGGELRLASEPGNGSTFSIYLPQQIGDAEGSSLKLQGKKATLAGRPPEPRLTPQTETVKPAGPIEDDRDGITETDRVILMVEDDLRFARILSGIIRERGFKCLAATTGEEGLELARTHKPNGILLDIQLPGMDGWAVLNSLKQDISLRHIPVHIISVEESSAKNLGVGAIGHASKPIDREQILHVLERLEAASARAPKRVLVVEDDDLMRRETVRIVGNGNVTVHEAATGESALQALRDGEFALVIMDLGLPDMQGIDLLKQIAGEKIALPPVIIHTVRELTMDEEYFLRHYADSIIIKDVRSQERLIDEVALFLHRVVRELPEENRRAILHLHESDEPLRGKKVLIVEDDMRTMFAMARVLAGHGVNPLKAEHGERALALLDEQPDVDLVLMDIMMPVMDGYDAIQRIRSQERFAKLPIISLTAKAMKEDRQKCLAAGATDYLSKPVDPDRLVSLMRVLLCR